MKAPDHHHLPKDVHPPTYKSWRNMKKRCNNKNYQHYRRYGGRGIMYQASWESYSNFLSDMGERPEGTSLDRIDPDGNYSVSNCTWATHKSQSNNKTTNVFIKYEGESKTIKQWAEVKGIPYKTLFARIKYYGMSVKDALTMPVRNNKCVKSTI